MGTAAAKRQAIMALKAEMASAIKAEKDRRKRKAVQAEYEGKLRALEGDSDASEEEEEEVEENKKPSAGPSRSELRREKKQLMMAERKTRLLSELEKTDLSHSEMKKILEFVPDDYDMLDMQADGSCLFHGIAHQLARPGVDAAAVRRDVAAWIRAHAADYEAFLIDVGLEDFCASVENPTTFGGEIEIKAASEAYDTPIDVYTSEGIIHYGEPSGKSPLRLVYLRHQYGSCHYNVLVQRRS